ncbi:MAG: biopolymer transporter ExbD [Lentisphaerae bacterium]|nr:biopolymer transporter ExbD [Lentisphaerota bacterium]MBQ4328295.1 biopolymer transporter ExbD [Lentisphaeria bacterium]MBR2720716.1 biopolymer transporter ExbD [Lentisphaeria bacterium]
MSRRKRRNRPQMAAIDQINVTPLLDLVFLLLIAFMITMPLMEYGTSVKTPEMNSGSLPQENLVTVELTKDGTFMLDREMISEENLRIKLKEMSTRDPKPELLVRGDGERSYKSVIELLALVRNCGFENATLVTQAESNKQ